MEKFQEKTEKSDLYDQIIKKHSEFIDNIHEEIVSQRYFFKSNNFKDIVKKDSKFFYKILFYKNYSNRSIETLNEEDACEFLDFEENRIFVEFNDNLFNFNLLKQEEKLIQLNLGVNEEEQEQVEESDFISIHNFPVDPSHCNFVFNCDKNFPQVLSNELISQALEIFSLTEKNMVMGYDSLNAGCYINHLHFELIWLEDKLTIEQSPANKIFSTTLQCKDENEINTVIFFFSFILVW